MRDCQRYNWIPQNTDMYKWLTAVYTADKRHLIQETGLVLRSIPTRGRCFSCAFRLRMPWQSARVFWWCWRGAEKQSGSTTQRCGQGDRLPSSLPPRWMRRCINHTVPLHVSTSCSSPLKMINCTSRSHSLALGSQSALFSGEEVPLRFIPLAPIVGGWIRE